MKKLFELLETITAKQAEIDSHGKLNDQLAKRIQHKFRLDWNYYSNAMEGNSLTKIETKQLMMDNVTIDGKPFKDIAEMRGHDNEVLEIFKIGKGDLRISEKRIKQMHAAIIHEEDPEKKAFIGQWKTSDNYLINYRGEKFQFLPFGEVKDAMHDLLNKTNADIDAVLTNKKDAKHPALIAFEFHLRYLEIHPFYDGNGRTGRLLLNLILISFGYPPVILDDKNRDSYYRLLAEVQGYGLDPKECYTFLAELLIRSQDLILDAIAGKEIEEDDDLIKEISLWKSQISHETSNVLSRTDSLIANVYKESIRPLFETYMNETKVFDDMFVEKITSNLFNKTYRTVDHLELFDRWFEMKDPDLITDRDNSKEKAMFILAEKVQKLNSFFNKFQLTQNDVANENEIGLHINWKGFKYNGTEAFQIVNEIKIRFDLYRFEIINNQFSQEKKIEKLYSEKLTQSEIKEFVNTVIKQLFEIIKQNVELTKSRRK